MTAYQIACLYVFHGLSQATIRRQTGLAEKTVRRYLAQLQVPRSPGVSRKLGPYRARAGGGSGHTAAVTAARRRSPHRQAPPEAPTITRTCPLTGCGATYPTRPLRDGGDYYCPAHRQPGRRPVREPGTYATDWYGMSGAVRQRVRGG